MRQIENRIAKIEKQLGANKDDGYIFVMNFRSSEVDTLCKWINIDGRNVFNMVIHYREPTAEEMDAKDYAPHPPMPEEREDRPMDELIQVFTNKYPELTAQLLDAQNVSK